MDEMILPTIAFIIFMLGFFLGNGYSDGNKEDRIKKSCDNYGQYVMEEYRLTCKKRGK